MPHECLIEDIGSSTLAVREDLRQANLDLQLAHDEIGRLKRALDESRQHAIDILEAHKPDADAYRKLIRQRDDTFEWCVEQATNEDGVIDRRIVDPRLGADAFILGQLVRNGKRVRLQSTEMIVEAI